MSGRVRGCRVLLSFDAEEFDLPLEGGQAISLDEQMAVGGAGMRRVVELLEEVGRGLGGRGLADKPRVTFFCTAVFAERFAELIRRAVAGGHEIASHGVEHGAAAWRDEHLAESRARLERVSGTACRGFRRPRLAETDRGKILAAGYRYSSNEHPTWIPGRYNGLSGPRRPYVTGEGGARAGGDGAGTAGGAGLVNIPASVTPVVRWPLFWLSFKVMPMWWYAAAARRVMASDPALVLYFHPWELCDLRGYRVPRLARVCDGERMTRKLAGLVRWLGAEVERGGGREGAPRWSTYAEFADEWLAAERAGGRALGGRDGADRLTAGTNSAGWADSAPTGAREDASR